MSMLNRFIVPTAATTTTTIVAPIVKNTWGNPAIELGARIIEMVVNLNRPAKSHQFTLCTLGTGGPGIVGHIRRKGTDENGWFMEVKLATEIYEKGKIKLTEDGNDLEMVMPQLAHLEVKKTEPSVAVLTVQNALAQYNEENGDSATLDTVKAEILATPRVLSMWQASLGVPVTTLQEALNSQAGDVVIRKPIKDVGKVRKILAGLTGTDKVKLRTNLRSSEWLKMTNFIGGLIDDAEDGNSIGWTVTFRFLLAKRTNDGVYESGLTVVKEVESLSSKKYTIEYANGELIDFSTYNIQLMYAEANPGHVYVVDTTKQVDPDIINRVLDEAMAEDDKNPKPKFRGQEDIDRIAAREAAKRSVEEAGEGNKKYKKLKSDAMELLAQGKVTEAEAMRDEMVAVASTGLNKTITLPSVQAWVKDHFQPALDAAITKAATEVVVPTPSSPERGPTTAPTTTSAPSATELAKLWLDEDTASLEEAAGEL